jgi:subtilisin-like proprotein convertase family protein
MFQNLPLMPRSWKPAALASLLSLAAPLGALAQQVLWADNPQVPTEARRFTSALRAFRPIEVHMPALRAALLPAPAEQGAGARNSSVVVSLPLPQGGSERFRVTQVPVMAPELARQFPTIKTYQAQGIDDPSAIARLDVSPVGFHAMVIGSQGTYYIDPARPFGDDVHHLVFSKRDMDMRVVGFQCLTDAGNTTTPGLPGLPGAVRLARLPNGTQLKTYRLALANTPEYALTKGNTLAGVMAGKVASVNRVSGVYETEVAVRLVLIANNSLLDFLSNTGPQPNPAYTNNSDFAMVNENQQNVDRLIGNANYDIGHVFSTGGGGYGPGQVCRTGQKAQGVTGDTNPVGDAFDIDFVAHEMGHQFSANHTFHASAAGNCVGPNGARTDHAAYEPGSGSTIMGYAGICSPENIQANTDPYFHSYSFDQIVSYINGQGNCATTTPTNNGVPVPNAGANYRIPRNTPFALTGSATDPDNDPLTYEWVQFNRTSILSSINAPVGDAPIFRAFPPRPTPTRVFPQLSDILNNTQTLGERLPTYSRRLIFRFVARDNRVGGGGVDYDSMHVAVVGTAGPFLVQYPNTSTAIWQAGAPARVRWDVANTTAAPINAANVDILLSTDGGFTYPITLATATPNDGNETLTLPLTVPATTTARVMVRASGNVFFDLSNENFPVEGNNGPTFFLTSSAPATLAACPGATATAPIEVGQILGFTGAVSLSATALPAGITVSYAAATVQAGTNTTATINVAAGTPAGTYSLILTGTQGGVTRSQELLFTVLPAATGTAVAQSPNFQNQTRTVLRPRFVWTAVPNAVTYDLQVSTDANFATLVVNQSNITAPGFTPATQLLPNTAYFWRVRAVSPCGMAPFSATQTFQTGTQTCTTTAATDVPRTIFNTANVTVTSTINIAAVGQVGEVRLRNLVLTHPDVSELEIKLRNPQMREVVLLARGTCPSTADLHLNFDDLAAAAVACPANAGTTVRAAGQLSELAGSSATGAWVLTITDNTLGNGGRLTDWGLELCTLDAVPNAPLSLSALYTGDQRGTNEVFYALSPDGPTPTYLELQRSTTPGSGFVTVAPSIPLSSNGIWEDVVPASGRYYYRLRACNATGCSAYTSEASVLGAKDNARQLGIAVFPNPSTGLFTLTVDNAQRGAVALRVTDALGRTVAAQQLSKGTAALSHPLDLSKLAPGVYQLHVALPDGTVVQRLLKQ